MTVEKKACKSGTDIVTHPAELARDVGIEVISLTRMAGIRQIDAPMKG
jgi:tRNA threonylcarbamoyladenosine modification (KEOPS) complex Cgi121 subunit